MTRFYSETNRTLKASLNLPSYLKSTANMLLSTFLKVAHEIVSLLIRIHERIAAKLIETSD